MIEGNNNSSNNNNNKNNNSLKLSYALGIFLTVDIIIWIFLKRYLNNNKTKPFTSPFTDKSTSNNPSPYANFEEYLKRNSQKYKTNSNSNENQQNFNSNTNSYKHTNERKNEQKKTSFSSIVEGHLRVLELKNSLGNLPNEAEVKEAYRKVCLKTHPDTFDSNDPKKDQAQIKFIEATNSYNYLLKYLKK